MTYKLNLEDVHPDPFIIYRQYFSQSINFFFEILEALAHHVRTRFEHPHRRHAQTWVDSQEVLDRSYQRSHTPTGKDRNGSDSHGIGFG